MMHHSLKTFKTQVILICDYGMITYLSFHKKITEKNILTSSRGGLGGTMYKHSCHFLLPEDQIPLGETIPAISIFYVYMIPTSTDVYYKYK